MRKHLLGLCLALVGATPAMANDALPSNLLYDANRPNKTIWPLPAKNMGELKWNDHRQDLSRWPTLSYEDKRSTAKPRKVELQAPLNGDAENGKKIAMNTQRGNCWACHVLPGDPQGGTGGPPLMNVGSWGYSDAHLYQQVFDRRVANPETFMPPYGSNGVLTEQEIRDVVAYLQSLK